MNDGERPVSREVANENGFNGVPLRRLSLAKAALIMHSVLLRGERVVSV